eukprot:m.33309 g.33309  ORF g.33309 m.33309 type:complete len:477 (+) comp9856_c0_seq1:144-1574(+)
MEEDLSNAPKVVLSGFLTKRGHFRKNWKRRHFELGSDLKLSYFNITGHRKKAGMMDLRFCTHVIPGGDCNIKWFSGANPHCCFGIMTSKKRLYVFSRTKEDVALWLEELRKVLPPHVPVTTLEEISASFKMASSSLPDTEDKDVLDRVTIFPNASIAGGKVIRLPLSQQELLREASKMFNFKATKLFFPTGADVYDYSLIKDNGVVIVADESNPRFTCHEGAVWANIRQDSGNELDSDNEGGEEGEEDLSYEGMLAELEKEASHLKRHLSIRIDKQGNGEGENDSDSLDTVAEEEEDDEEEHAAEVASLLKRKTSTQLFDTLDDALETADDDDTAYLTLEEIRSRMDGAPFVDEEIVIDEDDREEMSGEGNDENETYLEVGRTRVDDTEAGYMDLASLKAATSNEHYSEDEDGDGEEGSGESEEGDYDDAAVYYGDEPGYLSVEDVGDIKKKVFEEKAMQDSQQGDDVNEKNNEEE